MTINKPVESEKTTFRPSSSRFTWQWLSLIAFVLMEINWVTPWLLSLHATISQASLLPMVLLGSLVVLVTNGLMRLAQSLRLNQQARRFMFIFILAVFVILGQALINSVPTKNAVLDPRTQAVNNIEDFLNFVPAWLWITLIVFGFCWRGAVLARAMLGPIMVFDHFRWGILMFGLFALSGFVIPLAKIQNPLPNLFGFLFFGLISLVASRISILTKLRGGTQNPFDGRWALVTGLSAFGFILLAYTIALLATGQAELFWVMFTGVLFIVGAVIAAPILLIFYWLTPALEQARLVWPTPNATQESGFEDFTAYPPLEDYSNLITGDPAFVLPPVMRPLLIVAGLLVVLGLLVWSFRWYSRRDLDQNLPVEHEDLLPASDLPNQLKHNLQQRIVSIKNLFTKRRLLTASDRLKAASRIRAIYAELLKLAEEAGYPRAASLTPLEYQTVLEKAFWRCPIEVQKITSGYNRVRYGQLPETEEELSAYESDWLSIQQHHRIERGKNRLYPGRSQSD
jgi:hypothetical protein